MRRPGGHAGAGRSSAAAADALAVFAVLWALATLFHVWVNPRSAGVLRHATLLGTSHVLLSVAALVVLWRPRETPALVALAVLGLWTCWLEAPLLGNHWLLAALVDLGLLLAMAASRRRGGRTHRLAAGFLPTTRWVLISFYAFAAFAKLNHGFLDPKVSCGVFYGNELKRSLYLGGLPPTGTAAVLLPVAVIVIEVAIPALLVPRATRHVGVVIGLVYHSVIALDMAHLFSDFSAVLAALFVLFLPQGFATGVVTLARRHVRAVQVGRASALAASTLLLAVLWIGGSAGAHRVFVDGRAWAWVVADFTVLVLVLRFVVGSRRTVPTTAPASPTPRWLFVIPALVVANGLTPYLELKTAYAWNMYSNLETVGGRSNHLLVPSTLAMSHVQDDMVRIVATNDPGLGLYVTGGYELPFLQCGPTSAATPTCRWSTTDTADDRRLPRRGLIQSW